MFRRALGIALLVSLVLPLVVVNAQGGEMSGEITVVTFMTEWVEAFETAAADYMELHPGVEVNVSTVPYDGLQDFYRTNMVGGTAPEIMHAEGWWNNLASLDLILGFDEYYAQPNPYNEGETPWGETFVQPFLDFSRDAVGNSNAIPWSLFGVGYFYDKTYFEANDIAVPTTWGEFIDTCDAIKANGDLPMYVALKGNDAQWQWPLFQIGNFAMRGILEDVNLLHADDWAFDYAEPTTTIGEALTVDESWVAFQNGLLDPLESPEYRAVAELMADWSEACLDREAALAADGEEVYSAFWTGQSKIFMNGTWFISTLDNELASMPEDDRFEWSIFEIPSPTVEEYGEVFSMGSVNQNMGLRNGFIVPAGMDPDQEALTVDFLQFMTSEAEATKLFSLNRIDEETGAEFPWSYDPAAIVDIPLRPGTEALYPRIDYAELFLFLFQGQGDTQGRSEFMDYMPQYLGGNMEIDDVLDAWSFSLEDSIDRAVEAYADEIDQDFVDANVE